MKQIVKYRWAIIALWIVTALSLSLLSPNLQALVAEKGQLTIPDEYPSKQANRLLAEMSSDDVEMHDIVLVFHRDEGLDETDKKDIKTVIDRLNESKDELEIASVLDFSEDERIEASTVSSDNTTLLVPIEAATEKQTIGELREKITAIADEIDVPHALTSEELINEDIVINSQEGLKKTTVITVILILVILLVVFRSAIAPVIPLITVGISYLVAESIVAYLAEYVNFPLSTYTQIFMIAIMFGIGTDYTILLISRFKEELTKRDSTVEAVIATYKASGKTIFYAALAVLIGFSTIGLSKFTLYQSAVSVAVGVLVVTLALFTILPFVLVFFGKRLFWPFDKNVEHKESKLWARLGHFTWTRPIRSLII
ncbi:MAG: MMPL family transporter, partial [Bacilli bacterium]|nr:MMPL family transporter [Bacilli bacterium]